MNRTRLKSELLATLSLGADDKFAVADVLAALVALSDRAGDQRGLDQPSAPGKLMPTETRECARQARVRINGKREIDEHWPEDRGRYDLPSGQGRTGVAVAAAGTGPDRHAL
jgi:hypothetical protein